jgi:hypothetical protein
MCELFDEKTLILMLITALHIEEERNCNIKSELLKN